ncbi:portal protein [Cellvibrio zantedeschiae]|uniref:Portal protein n=1 Tax=Cellvibrio zantedeschiae TaxID=1237077 RepID=A0ABQ3B563_9GAMM|nr:monovalent cation:proton antiporter-2 (CPA2) family protein [Cellvibrio zantedeschiae]GGY79804.1 portal protein [Cellvibrio zantedeschiae]
MDHHSKLQVIYFLLAAIVAVPIFRRLGLGAILGYLIAGAAIGPYALKLIPDPASAMHLAEFGVVMLLFVIGLEINPARLWEARNKVVLLGGGQMLLTGFALAVVLSTFVFEWKQAILVGLTLALSSTAFAVPLMEEKNYMATPMGRDGFAVLLMQDLAVIPLLLLLAAWSPVQVVGESSPPLWWGLIAIAGVILAGRYLLTPLLNIIARYGSREIMTATDLLVVLGTAMLMEAVGLSMGMGAFMAGLLLTSSSFKHQLAADIEPFKGLLLGLFFIAVGMTLDLDLLWAHPILIVSLALAMMLIKALTVGLIFRIARYAFKEAFVLGLLMAQGGEFAFVIMDKAKLINFIPSAYANYTVLVVGVSMALTAPLVIMLQALLRKEKIQNQAFDTVDDAENEVIIVGFGRFGQIVGRIMRASDVSFSALEKDATQVDFMKQFGAKSYFGDATRMDLLEAAGIAKATTLVVAIDNVEDSVTIVREVKHLYPHIKFIVRARNRLHAYQLQELGIADSIRETFDSSLLAASRTLSSVGFTDSQVIEKVGIYRDWDEKILLRAGTVYKDDAALRVLAKEGADELRVLMNRSDI